MLVTPSDHNYNQPIQEWCTAHHIDIDLSQYLPEEMEDEAEDEVWWEAQEAVLEELQGRQNDPLLEEFCDFIGMSRFAFVHEEIVAKDGFLSVTLN
jgi:hypothetical protein